MIAEVDVSVGCEAAEANVSFPPNSPAEVDGPWCEGNVCEALNGIGPDVVNPCEPFIIPWACKKKSTPLERASILLINESKVAFTDTTSCFTDVTSFISSYVVSCNIYVTTMYSI